MVKIANFSQIHKSLFSRHKWGTKVYPNSYQTFIKVLLIFTPVKFDRTDIRLTQIFSGMQLPCLRLYFAGEAPAYHFFSSFGFEIQIICVILQIENNGNYETWKTDL